MEDLCCELDDLVEQYFDTIEHLMEVQDKVNNAMRQVSILALLVHQCCMNLLHFKLCEQIIICPLCLRNSYSICYVHVYMCVLYLYVYHLI